MSKPDVKDPPKSDDKKPDDKKPAPTGDLAEIKSLLVDLKKEGTPNAGLLAMMSKAQEINGKLDTMLEFIDSNPASTVKEAIDAFRAALTVEKEPDKEPAKQSLVEMVFESITFGQFSKKD